MTPSNRARTLRAAAMAAARNQVQQGNDHTGVPFLPVAVIIVALTALLTHWLW